MNVASHLRSTVAESIPSWINRTAHQALHRYHISDPILSRLGLNRKVDFVAFDDAFPEAVKHNYQAPYTVSTPELENISVLPDSSHLQKSTYEVPEDYIALLNNALVSSTNNVILSPNRQIIVEASNCRQLQWLFKREMYKQKPVRLEGLATPFHSRFHNYYHVFFDCLPRLIAIAESSAVPTETIKLLCKQPLSALERQLIEAVAPNRFEVIVLDKRRLYDVDTLIFTPLKRQPLSGYLAAPYIENLRELHAADRDQYRTFPVKNIYVSRSKAERRRVLNEDLLIERLKEYNFELYHLEDLTIGEKFNLFDRANIVVSPTGASLTSLLCSTGLDVIELTPTPLINPEFYLLSRAVGNHSHHWITGTAEEYNDNWHVDVGAVIERVESILSR